MTLRGGLAALVTSVALTSHAGLAAQTAPAHPRGSVPADAVDRSLATAVEQALIEHACAGPVAGATDTGGHDECLRARLDALRADFGRDLSRLSSTDRHAIDTACAPIRAAQGREGYVNCLASQLAVLRNRASRARGASADAPAVPEVAPTAVASVVVESPRATARASVSTLMAAVAATAAVACALLLFWRSRRMRHACKVCGTRIGNGVDLCAPCRHQAAEALRRSAAERVEQQRAQENEARRLREREDEERRRIAQQAEHARLQELELQRRIDDEAAEQARRRDAEDAAERERAAAADAATPAFDPYAVLGVPRDATLDAVRAAYEQARAKYDLEQVADLGLEVREHYIAKAQAAERAYETLAASLSEPADSEPPREPAPLLDPHPESAPIGASS